MVSPVTGPFTSTQTALGPSTSSGFRPEHSYRLRTWYRQRRPYSLPLAFTTNVAKVTSFTGPGSRYDYRHWYMLTSFPAMSTTGMYPNAYNKAYERFKASIQPESAGLGIGLAQRQLAINMIGKRATQVVTTLNALRRGNIPGALRELGVLDTEKGRKVVKRYKKYTFNNGTWRLKHRYRSSQGRVTSRVNFPDKKSIADSFLEVHFGWVPLVKDVYSSIDVLQSGVPPVRVSASATSSGTAKYNSDMASNPVYYYGETDKMVWRIQADVAVSNPNLWLANQLGLVNPAVVVWDGIPFSFVLGWFVNVDSFLNSFTDFWGLSLTNTCCTAYWSRQGTTSQVQKNWPKNGVNTEYWRAEYYTYVVERRTGSIPGPSLRIKSPWRLSNVRAATAISLLVQQLHKHS